MTSTYVYPATSNRLSSVTPSGQSARSFAYDVSGDIVTDSRTGALGMSFEYDVEGRLSKAYQTNAPSQGGTYGYDAQDRLASRMVTGGATTLYVHDLDNHIIAETNAAGVTVREYLWLNDIPVAVVDGVNTATPTLYYVHTDHLGRPARMIAQNWAWVWDVIYSPFGGTAAIYDATTKLDMRFPGQWFQLESGLAYNWHRHYDATLGRYVQPDQIGYGGGRSLYGYVGQNPLAYIDPDGLRVVLRCGPVIAGANHCHVNVIPDDGGPGDSCGLGGPDNTGASGKISGGYAPPPYHDPKAPFTPAPDQAEYPVYCPKSDDDVNRCLKTCHVFDLNVTKPPPYYALWQNSNSYAHNLLRRCGCTTSQRPAGAVA